MTDFTTSVDIHAPPGRVWDILLDVERWPEWTATVTSAVRLDRGPYGAGSSFRILQPKLRPAIWHVTQLDHYRRIFTWATRRFGVTVYGRHQVEEAPGGSRVTLSLQFVGLLGPLMAYLYRNLNNEYLATEAASLKKRSER